MSADYSGRRKTGQPALGVQLLGLNTLADLNTLTNLKPWADLNTLANLKPWAGLNTLADLKPWAGPNMLANLKPWAGPNMLAGFNFNPLPGPNMLAGLAAQKLLADHLLRGSAPIRAEAEAMSGMSGILSLDLPVYLDAVPKQADDQLRQVDPPCPAMQRAAVPPDRACFFLDLCLGKADREIMRGDLEEEFTTSILPRYGARRAQFWFWGQTVGIIARRNAICRWVLVSGLVRFAEWILRQISS